MSNLAKHFKRVIIANELDGGSKYFFSDETDWRDSFNVYLEKRIKYRQKGELKEYEKCLKRKMRNKSVEI